MATTRSGLKPQIPVLEPPEGQAFTAGSTTATGQSQPTTAIPSELGGFSGMDLAQSAPAEQPPAAAVGAVTGTWTDSKTFDALWTVNENRNSWARVTGANWVKFLNTSDNIVMALSALAANAKVTKGTVKFRTEADNMVHEIYVW